MSTPEEPRPADQDDDAPADDQSVDEFVKEIEEDPASNPPAKELDDLRGG